VQSELLKASLSKPSINNNYSGYEIKQPNWKKSLLLLVTRNVDVAFYKKETEKRRFALDATIKYSGIFLLPFSNLNGQ
jgi:hypothetical protein